MTANPHTVSGPAMLGATAAFGSAPVGPSGIASGEVHVWCADLDVSSETVDRLYATLAVNERNRCARLRLPRDLDRFIAAHGALLDILGHYLQTDPARISYEYRAFGKPVLSRRFGGRLRFSLSHSAGLALIALAADSDVGVDLEYIGARLDYGELAETFFSAPEVRQLGAIPEHLCAEAFFGCWTKKEAYVKARGGGLTIPTKSFTVPLTTDPGQGPARLYGASMGWSLYTLRPTPEYIGAVAIPGCGWRVDQLQWRPG
jgi:4'-phosphopantetheinyl transferase